MKKHGFSLQLAARLLYPPSHTTSPLLFRQVLNPWRCHEDEVFNPSFMSISWFNFCGVATGVLVSFFITVVLPQCGVSMKSKVFYLNIKAILLIPVSCCCC